MPQAEFRYDMSLMLAMHDALRRELAQLARIAGLPDDHPGGLLHAALAWDLLKEFLTARDKSEDDALWPPLRAAMAGNPDWVALAGELEAEHAEIAPLLAADGLPLAAVSLSARSSSTSVGSTSSCW